MSTDQPPTLDESLDEIFSDHFHDVTYNCTRVWGAWQYGTMGQDDFVPADEDEEFLTSLKAAIKALVLTENITVAYIIKHSLEADTQTGMRDNRVPISIVADRIHTLQAELKALQGTEGEA